jgi:hypothetical protein
MKNRQVFINAPFSHDYQEHFRAIIFTVIRCGFRPRCALETDDGSLNRFDKICDIIRDSLGIHNISITELDADSRLPRFNMPLELGLFLAAKKFGDNRQRTKKCIILDKAQHRYQRFISDIAGQDIHSHGGKIDSLIVEVASWLRNDIATRGARGGKTISIEFQRFSDELPELCAGRLIDPAELTFVDYRRFAAKWIIARDRLRPRSADA